MMRLFDKSSAETQDEMTKRDIFVCMKLAVIDTADAYNTQKYMRLVCDLFNDTGEPRKLFTNKRDAIDYLNKHTSSVHCVYQVQVPETAIMKDSPTAEITVDYKIQPNDIAHTFFHAAFTPLPAPPILMHI